MNPSDSEELEPIVLENIRHASHGDQVREKQLIEECLRTPTLRAFFRNPGGGIGLTYTSPDFSNLRSAPPKKGEDPQ